MWGTVAVYTGRFMWGSWGTSGMFASVSSWGAYNAGAGGDGECGTANLKASARHAIFDSATDYSFNDVRTKAISVSRYITIF